MLNSNWLVVLPSILQPINREVTLQTQLFRTTQHNIDDN